MAGKTKKSAARPETPKAMVPEFKGHMGLKSSPYCVTDAKYTSQIMVRDRMNAHYKKLSQAKPSVDTKPPKSMLISTKKRDQARRESMKMMYNSPRNKSSNSHASPPRPISRATSDMDRQELLAAYASFNDEVYTDYRRREDGSLDVQPPSDLTASLDDKIQMRNTPHSARLGRTYMGSTLKLTSPHSTPRGGDILETHKHAFTDTEKQFQPRILKTDQKSKLSQLKYYNPPVKKKAARSLSPDAKIQTLRSETAMTNYTMTSTELMNESLVSRDINQVRTPTGVPPLDISLDKDHLKWLQEQSVKAQTRSARPHSRTTDHSASLRLTHTYNKATLHPSSHNVTRTLSTGQVPVSPTLIKVFNEEEELKYLDFIRDVTSDVLDRGIFTNRVLKKVFHSHVEKHKHLLDVYRMQEMLNDLKADLGIPDDDNGDDSFGHGTINDTTLSMTGKHSPLNGRTLNKTADLSMKSSSKAGRSSSPSHRPPIPKPRTASNSSMTSDKPDHATDINENIIDFDMSLTNITKVDETVNFLENSNRSNNQSGDEDEVKSGRPVTLDDLEGQTTRSSVGPDTDTFRNIVPAVSSAVRSGTFGDSAENSPTTSPRDGFPTGSPAISRQVSVTSVKSNTEKMSNGTASPAVSRQVSVTSVKSKADTLSQHASVNKADTLSNGYHSPSVSRQDSVTSTMSRAATISRQGSVTSVKSRSRKQDSVHDSPSISRQDSVTSVKSRGDRNTPSPAADIKSSDESDAEDTERNFTGRSKGSEVPNISDTDDKDDF